jgi:DNA-dependent RNA polymerase auxiliary subunit epsilon
MHTQDIFIITPKTQEQANALKAFAKALKMKLEVARAYDPEFVEKIEDSKKQYEKGDFVSINEKEDLKKMLGLP